MKIFNSMNRTMSTILGISVEEERKKIKVINEIIYKREFDVPDSFITTFVTTDVIEYMLNSNVTHFNDFAKYSSVKMLKDASGKMIQNYITFLDKIRRLNNTGDYKVTFCNKSFLSSLTTPIAVLTLKSDKEWRKFIRIKKSNTSNNREWMIYLSYLVDIIVELNFDIPKIVLQEIISLNNLTTLSDVIDEGIMRFASLEKIIKQSDDYEILYDQKLLLLQYIKHGGIYFPENESFINNMVMLCYDEENFVQSILDIYRVNTEKTTKSFGYYLLTYMMSIYDYIGHTEYRVTYMHNPSMNGIYTPNSYMEKVLVDIDKISVEIACNILDELFSDISKDINVLEYIFKLPLQGPALKAILEKIEKDQTEIHQGWKNWIDCVIEFNLSDIPLSDMKLYKKLFPKNIPNNNVMLSFIKYGGNPTTIKETIPNEYNICYNLEGIKTILKFSSDEHVLCMFNDDIFVKEFERYLFDRSMYGFVDIKDIKRILDLIMKEGISSKLTKIVDQLIVLSGENIPFSCIGYKVSNPNVKYDFNAVKQLINTAGISCIEQIPIQILPQDLILRRIRSSNISGENGFLSLKITTVYLDDIFTVDNLNNLIVYNKKYEYIPDLSFDAMKYYLDKISK